MALGFQIELEFGNVGPSARQTHLSVHDRFRAIGVKDIKFGTVLKRIKFTVKRGYLKTGKRLQCLFNSPSVTVVSLAASSG